MPNGASSELKPFESAFHAWISAIGSAADRPAVRARLSAEAAERLPRLALGLAALSPWFEAYAGWLIQQTVVDVFLANSAELGRSSAFRAELARLRTVAAETVRGAPALVGSAPYPFTPPATNLGTAAEVLHRSVAESGEDARLPLLLHLVHRYYFRLLGEMAAIGEELERVLITEAPAPASPAGSPSP
jgi:hypothetical protein